MVACFRSQEFNMFKISEKANPNYLAQIVRLENLRQHPNADRLQLCAIQGNNIIVSLDAQEGDAYIYFPLECAINKEFLSWSNSFSDKTLNQDQEVAGFFSNKGRVRAVKLRGTPSEGYAIPADKLLEWLKEKTGQAITFNEKWINQEFDTFDDILVCEKYVNQVQQRLEKNQNKNKKGKKPVESKLISGQFHFHIDTPQLKKLVSHISPSDYISITKKYHGTSAVVSSILCYRKLNWFEKILKRFGVKVQETEYDMVYSSRKVIKNGTRQNELQHYYSSDIWGTAAKYLQPTLEPGITLYLEIVGFVDSGQYIQPKYDYGCDPGKYDIYVYRITHTDSDGRIFEYSPAQVDEYCKRKGIKAVETFYYGKAGDLFDVDVENHWHQNFLQKMCETYLEKDCSLCKNKVPDEGVVLRRDVPNAIDVYKLKSFKFLLGETALLDNENFVDMESLDS